jgi:pSer/pThr/pTyr-binding forkhead associated (FHA) protein
MSEERTIVSPEADPLAAERTQVAIAPGAEVTQAAVTIECPVCHTTNPPGDRWCQDCGFLLASPAPEALDLPSVSGPRLVLDGREFELREGSNTLGRVHADVLLPDPTVSRHHATLTVEEDSVWISDEGSTNGTYLNGSPVTPGDRRRVQDGDSLKLGSVAVRLVWPEGGRREDGGEVTEAGEPRLGARDERQRRGPGPGAEEGPGQETVTGAETEVQVGRLEAEDGQEFSLWVGVNAIGRRAENMIALSADPFVSGRHAEVRCEPGVGRQAAGVGEEDPDTQRLRPDASCVLVDIGSTNGTFLRRAETTDWERLQPNDPQPLSSGDHLRVGQTVFTFQASHPLTPDEGEPEEPAA